MLSLHNLLAKGKSLYILSWADSSDAAIVFGGSRASLRASLLSVAFPHASQVVVVMLFKRVQTTQVHVSLLVVVSRSPKYGAEAFADS